MSLDIHNVVQQIEGATNHIREQSKFYHEQLNKSYDTLDLIQRKLKLKEYLVILISLFLEYPNRFHQNINCPIYLKTTVC